MGVQLTRDQVLAWRMHRQLLHRPTGVDPVAVVSRLGGVQAQVASAAQHAVATRRGETAADPTAALAGRTLVKTWAQRGTLHLLPADEVAAYLALIAAARTWERPPWQREFATADRMAALAEAVSAVLPGAVLTREELAAAIVEHTGDAGLTEQLGSGWSTVLKPLAWQGLLCQALPRDNRVTFTAPSTWLPDWEGLPAVDDAAATALPAYLGAHGPADPLAFDQWLTRGAHRKAVVRGWADDLVAAGVLTRVVVDGEDLVARTADVDALRGTAPTTAVRLLPAFDQYVLGPGTRDPHVISPARRSAVSRAAGWIAPVVVAAGRVAGTWQVEDDAVTVALFSGAVRVDPAGLDAELGVLERVLGRTLTMTVGTV